MASRPSPLKAARSISIATMCSRVLGLVRDQVQSYYFGAGVTTDAFLAAFRIPNLLRDLFAEGALSSAFVPTFTRALHEQGKERAWQLGRRVMTTLALVLGLLTLAILLFAPQILGVYVGGFTGEKMALAVTMTRILSPFLLFVALAAVAMGMLNAHGRFFLPALAPASFNVAAILGVIALVPVFASAGMPIGLALAVGAAIGGALQFLVQVPVLRREGFRFGVDLKPRDPGVRRVSKLMLPATFGLAATQINILVDTVIASRLGDGPITWLQLGFRLIQLPIGVFGVALATANLAQVSRDAARGDEAGLRRNLATSLRAAALVTLPATAGLIVLREPIVRLLFEHGEFTADSTAKTAGAVLCYALGLYAYALTKIQVPTFYALGSARWPVIASASAVAVKIGANFALIALLPRLGFDAYLGLALSTSLAAWTNFALLSWALRRRVGALGHRLLPVSAALALLAALMGWICWWALAGVTRVVSGGGIFAEALRVGAVVACGMIVVYLGARILRLPELTTLMDRFRSFAGPGSSD